MDLLECLNNRKAHIQSIVDVQTKANPRKLGLCAGIQMIKDIHSDGAGNDEENKIQKFGQTLNGNFSTREWTT